MYHTLFTFEKLNEFVSDSAVSVSVLCYSSRRICIYLYGREAKQMRVKFIFS